MRKRDRLWGKRSRRTRTTISHGYILASAQARRGDNQAALKNIEASMKQLNGWLNYLNGNFPGEGWDPGGAIQANIKNALAMISSATSSCRGFSPTESR